MRFRTTDLLHWTAQFASVLFLFLWCFGDWRWLRPEVFAISSVIDCLFGVLLHYAMTYWAFIPVALLVYGATFFVLEGLSLNFLNRPLSCNAKIWAAITTLCAVVGLEWTLVPVVNF